MRVFYFLFFLLFSSLSHAETLNLKGGPVRDFISWYSDKTGVSVVVPQQITGTVTVFNYRVDDKPLAPLVNAVLLGMGYLMVPGNPALIIPLEDSAPLH